MNDPFSWREAPRAEFAVIGHPVGHSLSPRMHSAALRALGLDMTYVAIDVPVGEVAQALDHLAELGYMGVNVTVPHKAEAHRWVSAASPEAVRIAVVNTIRFRVGSGAEGIATDGPGFIDTLSELGLAPGSAVLMLGAGGAARAIGAALCDAGFSLTIWNRTRSRAQAMVADLSLDASVMDSPDLSAADLVVNATSASIGGADLGLDWMAAKPGCIAYDLMYGPEPTPFLASAASSGVRTVDGRALLVAQGARSLEWWLGCPAPREAMAEAIR